MIYGDLSKKFELAGIPEKYEKWFYPTLVLPLFILPLGLLPFFLSLLFVLRLPSIFLGYMYKERKNSILQDLPVFLNSLSWMMSIYPLADAVHKAGYGAMKDICGHFWKGYSSGKSFESALKSFRISEELEEVADILLHIYRTGKGSNVLEKMAEKTEAKNLEFFRKRNARLQIFVTSYVVVSTVLPAVGSAMSIVFGNTTQVLGVAFALSSVLVVAWKLTA